VTEKELYDSISRFDSSVSGGRYRLTTTIDGNNLDEILDDIKKQNAKVEKNAISARYLWNYVRNMQPILDRVDDTKGASSNNKVVVNLAVAISRNLSAYTFPKGINYSIILTQSFRFVNGQVTLIQ